MPIPFHKIFTSVGIITINKYADPLTRLMAEYDINTPLRQAHFLAQLAQESGELRYTEENLNYSASRLMKVFPRYFKTEAAAKAAAYRPDVIANTVYANRMGNGDVKSGDGYLFRGRGLIQLTGRDNYQAFQQHLSSLPQSSLFASSTLRGSFRSVDDMAPLISTPELAVRSACWFWQTNNLNAIADRGDTDATVEQVTRRVNGGTHGLSQRIVYFCRALMVLRNM